MIPTNGFNFGRAGSRLRPYPADESQHRIDLHRVCYEGSESDQDNSRHARQAVRGSFLSLRSEEIRSVTHEPRLKYSEKGFLDCKAPWLLG